MLRSACYSPNYLTAAALLKHSFLILMLLKLKLLVSSFVTLSTYMVCKFRYEYRMKIVICEDLRTFNTKQHGELISFKKK